MTRHYKRKGCPAEQQAANGTAPKWQHWEILVLRTQWTAGRSLSIIAAMLNRSRSSIAGKAFRLGLKLKKRERHRRYSEGGKRGRALQGMAA